MEEKIHRVHNTNDEFCEATLGCFIGNNKGEQYAITSGHFTRHANQVYEENKEELGICEMDNDRSIDVGFVKIHRSDFFGQNEVFDPAGKKRSVKLFDGKICDLYSKQVFKCIPQEKKKTEGSVLKTCKYNTPIIGTIASAYVHELHKESITDRYFLVSGHSNENFAKEGESGTLLAVDEGHTDIYLVGIVSGGLNSNVSSLLVTCSYLPKAIEYLQSKAQSNLPLPTLNKPNSECQFNKRKIVCGATIMVKRPEAVSQIDFEIDEKLMDLLCITFKNDDSSKMMLITDYERKTRKQIFDRKEINEMAIFTPEGAEQVTLIYFYFTVQNLYALKYDRAKLFLKKAMRSLLKVTYSQLLLLCKCMTYVTWLYLLDDDSELLNRIFEEGLTFLNDHSQLAHFPKECLGYHYYDYSRYYVKKHERAKAIEIARLGFETLKNVFEENKASSVECENEENKASSVECEKNEASLVERETDAFNRFAFGLCQYAHVLLWCGENFDYADEDVPPGNIELSKNLLDSVQKRIDKAPPVQKVYYLLSLCDLHYRKNEISKSFDIAKQCLQQAKVSDMVEEQYAAGCRCTILRRKLKASKL